MRTVCGWCKAEMGTTPDGTDLVSHGCCAVCLAGLMAEMDRQPPPDVLRGEPAIAQADITAWLDEQRAWEARNDP
jgi:hypothetical protein